MNAGDGFQYQENRNTTPILQSEADLIFAFSEPSAKDLKIDFAHINKDFRMSNLDDLDNDFINKASIAMIMAQSFLNSDAPCVKNTLHDMFMVANISVGRNGFGMQTLVTKTLNQFSTLTRKSTGFMNKDNGGEQY